jgi:hypothetical protein
MDLSYTDEQVAFGAGIRRFLDENWKRELLRDPAAVAAFRRQATPDISIAAFPASMAGANSSPTWFARRSSARNSPPLARRPKFLATAWRW